MSTEIESLHEELFGFVPAKAGAAYERLTAVVLAALGWTDVTYDSQQRGTGRRADHQIDVVATSPDGVAQRVLIECKEYASTLGQSFVNALVGVRSQIGTTNAALVSVKGFTKGAREVAEDEGISLVRLQRYDPDPASQQSKFVESVHITLDWYHPSHTDVGVEPRPGQAPRTVQLRAMSDLRLRFLSGEDAESFHELFEAESAGHEAGEWKRRVAFSSGRLLPVSQDPSEDVIIDAVTWTETVVKTQQTIVTEIDGTPAVVVEQILLSGEVGEGRLLVAEDLRAWNVRADGVVTPRGDLTPGQP